jgi:2-oxoglutarate dehydrogenase E2 component (dihydrolipoamide succinyltransferase)
MRENMEIKIPEVGESIREVVVARWNKQDGDSIKRDELICELETDKVALEINAEADGVLHISVKEGETVAPGTVIGQIEPDDKDQKPAGKQDDSADEEIKPEPRPEDPQPAEEKAEPEKTKKKTEPEPAKEKTEEKLAEKKPEPGASKSVPAQKTSASPSSAAIASRLANVPDEGPVERTAMTPIRKRIAERLLEARQQTAMLTTFNEADMSRMLSLRSAQREAFQKKHGVKLGFMSFFVKACVESLKDFPAVNSRIDGNDIVTHHYYHIGMAIGTDRGLVVPVLRDADQLTFAGIEQAISDFAEKATTGKLELNDLTGGTFSISNGGVYGSVLSTPILNPPQSAILGMHAVQDRAVVRDGEIVVRPIMNLALSYDHRIIDGREAVGFLRQVKDYIENPEEMLLEM